MKKIYFAVLIFSTLGILPFHDIYSRASSQEMEQNFEALATLEEVVPKMNNIITYVEKKLDEYGNDLNIFEGLPLEWKLEVAVTYRETAGRKLIEIEEREKNLIKGHKCPRDRSRQYVLGMSSKYALELQEADKRMWGIIKRTDMVNSLTISYKRRSQAQIDFFKHIIAKAKECRLLQREQLYREFRKDGIKR